MCLLSSVTLRFDSVLNEALWLAYLDLKLVAVSPTYVSTLLLQVTTALHTISFVRHSPSRRHVVLLGQLRSFSDSETSFNSSLLFPSMIVFTLGMQLYEIFTVFRLKILWSLLVAGKQLSSILKNSLSMFVSTFRSYGGLYQIMLRFMDIFFASDLGFSYCSL